MPLVPEVVGQSRSPSSLKKKNPSLPSEEGRKESRKNPNAEWVRGGEGGCHKNKLNEQERSNVRYSSMLVRFSQVWQLVHVENRLV